MNQTLKGYLKLCRPPNLPTAAADILAGLALAGYFDTSGVLNEAIYLVMASVFLYAGGVVLNDVFDYHLDKVERPERPIPSGVVPIQKARIFGFLLLAIGVALAAMVHWYSFVIALALAIAILLYDSTAKHHSFFGPLTMGICRGLNLLLGISIFNEYSQIFYCIIPIIFIFAVTMISRGEVHGNNRKNIAIAGILYGIVIFSVFLLNQTLEIPNMGYLLFLGAFILMVFYPLVRAYTVNQPSNIKKAVKAGVMSLILLDATIATAHSDLMVGFGIVLLLPVSIILAKTFAVT